MEAYFFGENGRQLFGAYHEAAFNTGKGVVLAYPGPQEYMQCHYAFRLLALQLARAGFSVLRFDWTGTGDSEGNAQEVSFQQWRDDLQLAVQELRDISNVKSISVVAFRLGGAIAASTPFKQPIDQLVLWEPVIDGRIYLNELRSRELRKFGDLLEPPSWWRQGRAQELLGHAISNMHYTEIQSLDLARQVVFSTKRLIVVTQKITERQKILIGVLKEYGVSANLEEVNDSGSHVRDDSMLLAGAMIAYIVDRLKVS